MLLSSTDIGYGLRPEHRLQIAAKGAADAGTMVPADFDAFAAPVSE